jgi:hypothetical protein
LGEEFSGTADERLGLEVFVVARTFANEDELSFGIADAEDDVGARFVKLTASAICANVRSDFFEGIVFDLFLE